MSRIAFSLVAFLISVPVSAACDPAINVAMSRPYGSEAEPTVIYAKATSACAITTMRVYVDYKLIYEQHGQNTINGRLVLGAGAHRVKVVAWNSTGAVANDERFTVSTADPVEPLAGCEFPDGWGAFYTGDHIPYAVPSPVRIGMNARSQSARITSMRLYINGVDRAQTWGTSAYCLPVVLWSLKTGYQFINVQAWDALGHIYLTGSILQVQ